MNLGSSRQPHPRVRRRVLAAYDVGLSRETGKPTAVGDPTLFGTSYVMTQPRFFALDEVGWLKVVKLEGYALQRSPGRRVLQEVLFPYLDVL